MISRNAYVGSSLAELTHINPLGPATVRSPHWL